MKAFLHMAFILIALPTIGLLWLMFFVTIGVYAIVIIFLAGLAAAVAFNKGKGFIGWLLFGSMFPAISLIAAIAIRKPLST